MSHPDEGTIQMLLDGELGQDERARIEAHAAGCVACAAKIAAARAFQLEADRLVEVLDVPTHAATPPAPHRRGPMLQALAWAASIVLAVGLGYYGRGGVPTRGAETSKGDRPPPTSPTLTGQAVAPQVAAPPSTAAPAPGAAQRRAEAAPPAGAPLTDERQRSGAELKQPPSASPPPPTEAAGAAAREDHASRDASAPTANALQVKTAAEAEVPSALAAAGGRNEPVTGWRVIALEEAVRILGGQVRLIDGLSPERVETGPGTAVAGAEPSAAVVRVVYASGAIVLDEQRVGAAAAGGRLEAARAERAAVAPPVGWREAGAIRFAVTGSVPPDSLRALAARVR